MFAACAGAVTEQGPVLTQINRIANSVECPSGGVKVSTGHDWNGDGVLADGEVLQSAQVCNGTNAADGKNGTTGSPGVSSVTATAMLPAGDAHCPSGGAELLVGFDSGADGGITGNGQLEPSEVQSTQYLCNGVAPVFVRSTQQPPGPAGHAVISTAGGAATDGGAGHGGEVSVQLMTGSLGGNVKIFNTGSVDAGFEIPKHVFVPGAAPLRVTGDLRITTYESVEQGKASGDAVFGYASGGAQVAIAMQGGTGWVTATSLRIDSGAALRFAPLRNRSTLKLANDLENAGTLAFESSSAGHVTLAAAHVYGLGGSTLTGSAGVELEVITEDVINEGTVDFHGTDGVAAGSVSFSAKRLVSDGTIDLRGGNSVTGSGGHGGNLTVDATTTASLRGVVRCSGGDGLSSGGEAGWVGAFVSAGEVRLGGTFVLTGGRCTGVWCVAGAGNDFSSVAQSTVSDADIHTSGADGQALGGAGGRIRFVTTAGVISGVVGVTQISGTLTTNGGRGASGGSGGAVSISVSIDGAMVGQEVELLGYSGISTVGGSSEGGAAGHGGAVTLNNLASKRDSLEVGPSGAVVNAVELKTRGGDGAVGGQGGDVVFGASWDGHLFASSERALNSGHIDTGGGTGRVSSASSGSVTFNAVGDVVNSGLIELVGGGSMSASDSGRKAGVLAMTSIGGAVLNVGDVHGNGGPGRLEGGAGADISMHGVTCVNMGRIGAVGGQSMLHGGRGGSLYFMADADWPSIGDIDNRGGLGSPPGAVGPLLLNANLQ
jgi:hypothetical protein